MKKLVVIIILLNSLACFSQQDKISDFLFKTPQIVYFGIDFSHAKILDESPGHKKALYDSLLQEINLKFLSEQTEWLSDNLFKKIIIEEKLIHGLNKNYSDMPLSVNNNIQSIIKDYPNVNQAGTGLVFLVSSLDKHGKKVELYAVFFDISSKTILWMEKGSGSPRGMAPGLMGYWYTKVNGSIYDFIDTYKTQKAEKNVKIKPNNIFLKVFIDEISLGYEKKIDSGMFISVEAGYRVNYLNTWNYTGQPVPVEYIYRFLCFHGFTFRVDLKYQLSRRSSIGFVIGYQHLYCPELIWYPGGYGGTDDGEYKVWNQHNDEAVLQLVHFINFGYAPYPVQFFYGVGLKVCALSEHYSIDGYPNHKIPSDEHINETRLQPLVTFGLRIKLGSF